MGTRKKKQSCVVHPCGPGVQDSKNKASDILELRSKVPAAAQRVKCLPSKRGDLSSVSQSSCWKAGVATHTCNPRDGGRGGPLGPTLQLAQPNR